MSILKFKNLTIGYKSPLIRNINIKTHLGEVVLMVGDNGIGKTTLIKSILKQISLLEGRIEINNTSIDKLDHQAIAQMVSVVLSKYQLPEHYTTKDLIALGKYIHYPYYFKLTQQDAQEINHIISQLGLSSYADKKLSQLSDGNLQKAFIGRAIAQNTPIIILDEPTTHLDEKNKIAILKLLRQLAKEQNKLIIFSSHNWRLAQQYADQLWWLHSGRLHHGLVEDMLLTHPELQNNHTIQPPQKLKLPTIDAPELHKKTLIALLEKHFNQDLSYYQIQYQATQWCINTEGKIQVFNNLESLLNEIKTSMLN
ncbi:ABC transporter ATP-binding protein [Riemerella columbina]|uniref:ABC transporter ATP-binding protein n=1 Tax=Riemerella columbina TaxID=103810 RepID=UPI00037E595D|nr:ABC transporter ATP-binding protein [Riemerella columbina]